MGIKKEKLARSVVKAVMSLYEGSRTKVRVGSGFSEEFGVRVVCIKSLTFITIDICYCG